MINEFENNKKILVIEEVEDDTSLRNAINDKLTLEGFNVISAVNGEDGLAVALEKHPDLILLDIVMPKMDGITMMRKLRASGEWGKKVPIILLTNLSTDDDTLTQAIAENEPSFFLIKSNYTMKELVEKIKKRLTPA